MRNSKWLVIVFCLITGMVKAQEYRKVGTEKFRILDTSGFYLYSINKLVQGEKIARPENIYYFSVDQNSPVIELTMDNLEKAFASNPKFRYSLEASFHGDRQLIAYDKGVKMYKIKYLYSQTIK